MNDNVCDEEASARDLRDAKHLMEIMTIIGNWIDELAPHVHPLEHPGARWQPGVLVDVLREQNYYISIELSRLKGPFVAKDAG